MWGQLLLNIVLYRAAETVARAANFEAIDGVQAKRLTNPPPKQIKKKHYLALKYWLNVKYSGILGWFLSFLSLILHSLDGRVRGSILITLG